MFQLHMVFHGGYAIGLVANNEPFLASNQLGYNFRTYCFIVTNDRSNYLVLNKINNLVVVQLEKCPSGCGVIVRFPCSSWFFHIHQVHINNLTLLNLMLFFTFKTIIVSETYYHLWGIEIMHFKTM